MTRNGTVKATVHAPRVVIAVLLVLALASCSTKVSSDQGSGKGSDRTKPTLVTSDLADLLPTASNLGPDYQESDEADSDDTEDGDDSAFDAAFAERCPDALKLMDEESDDEDSLDRTFDAKDGRQVQVSVQIKDPDEADAELEQIRKAFADCKRITYTDTDELAYSIKLGAQADQKYGDNAVMLTIDVTVNDPSEFKPITIKTKMRLVRVGEVAISISAQSGYNQAAETEVDGDFGLLDSLAETMVSGAQDLQQ